VDLEDFSPWCGQPVKMLDIYALAAAATHRLKGAAHRG
jgi:hypothetical protein